MRSRKHMVMCVRKPDKDIVTSVEQLNPLADKHKILGVPFIRGIVSMLESMYLGMKAILFSGNTALAEETKTEGDASDAKGQTFTTAQLAIIGVGALGIVAVFFLVPYVLASWLKLSGVFFNITEALIRLAMFIGYLGFIASWGEFARVLRYHGAEHKAINAYEAGVPLDVEHVKSIRGCTRAAGQAFYS